MGTSIDPDKIFQKVYKGRLNLMTQTLIVRGILNPRFVYEITSGIGITGKPIFGVTILGVTSKGKAFQAHGLNQLFYSKLAAFEYLSNLKKMMKQGYK
jgi:hypothetical protein